ncbi:MAG: CRISPR system precrRNA processing endoribonuclease RAMP protein Cas6 [Gammaproteobacteria bacterium]|nr:CRISPR system precrRNA processing endoribonuclease RAMP protein Cas6 [Gammaproteobacteria bacterium]
MSSLKQIFLSNDEADDLLMLLPVARYRFEATFSQPLQLNWYGGSMLRGSFGRALKKLCCMIHNQECKGCLLSPKCPYTQIFDPQLPPGHPLQRFKTVPAPYVIEAPLPGYKVLSPNETLTFNMVLFGPAIEQLPSIIYAWKLALHQGVTKDRVRGELQKVEYLPPESAAQTVYQPACGVNTIPAYQISLPKSLMDLDHGASLELVTPMRIKQQGHIEANDMNAKMVLSSLLRRFQLLAELYGQQQKNIPIRETLPELAEKIVCRCALTRYDWHRYSSRQKQRMNLGGVMGRIELHGDLQPFSALLRLGEWIHLGGKTTFGLGAYRLTSLSKLTPLQ